MKTWPKHKTVDVEQLLDPVVKLYKEMKKKKNKTVDIPYEGYSHGNYANAGATSMNGEDLGMADVRKYQLEEKDRCPGELMIWLAFQLGVEQGARHFASQSETMQKIIKEEI